MGQLADIRQHAFATLIPPPLGCDCQRTGTLTQTAVRSAQLSTSSYMARSLKLRLLPKHCQAFLTSGIEVVFEQYLIGPV
jgi:hypothetical protein